MARLFRRVHHLGIAVERLEEAEGFFQRLAGLAARRGTAPPGSDLAFGILPVGDCELELMEPSLRDSVVGRFLARRGEGLHHVAFEVEDVRGAMAHCRALGLEVLSEEPLPGVDGTLTAFLHPRSCHGILLELVQDPRGQSQH